MRILIHDHSGHPFQIQLSRCLSRRGHDVLHVYNASFPTPRGAMVKQATDKVGFDIIGIELPGGFDKYAYFKRRMQEIQYARSLIKVLDRFNPDTIISSNTPLDSQSLLRKASRSRDINFIFWVQDLYSLAIQRILQKKVPIFGWFVASYYKRLERQLLTQSDQIIIITKDFFSIMDRWNIDRKKIHMIENWAPLEEVSMQPRWNSWARELELADKKCLLYAGTLARKHNPDLLLQVALHFRDKKNVKLVVVSEGPGVDWLKEKKDLLNLENVILLGFQPFERLSEVLGSATVLLAILESEAGAYSVPSKVLTYMCAGRPLLLAVPKENLAARIVSQNKAGLTVSPSDALSFVKYNALEGKV